jgi:hypothetical protein
MKRRICFWIMSIFIFITMVINVTGADTKITKTPHKIPELKKEIKIDGVLEDNEWKEALVLTMDYEVDPGENIKPPVKTEVLLFYGAKHLYAAFRAYDPKAGEIRAHVTDRDNIANDDYVGIVLDTFNDSRRAFVFQCNPRGIQADFMTTMIFAEEDWDGIWHSAGKVTEWGYVVEIKIPFTSLRFQKTKENQVWGFDAVRSYPRSVSHQIGLFPRSRSNNCYLCQAEKLVGFRGAKPGLNLEFDPTLSGILTQERESVPDGKFVKKKGKIEPGLTARWSFTPNLTLNAAVNPDFSQVEADAAQLDINTQFALFYPEKRPFFLEGNSFFRSRFFAVYTRSVVDPDWGVKVTGKEGKHAIGFFTVRDSVTNLWFPSSESTQITSADMSNIGTVLRYRMDVGKSSHLGALVTDREGDGYFNRVAGIDGDIRFTKTDRVFFQYLGSQTQYPDDIAQAYNQPMDRFDGGAFDCLFQHLTEHYFVFGHYQNVTSMFRADMGYVDQTGLKAYEAGTGYILRHNPGHWFTRIDLSGCYTHVTNQNNNMLQKIFQTWFNYFGPMQSAINVHATLGKQSYLGSEFDQNAIDFTAQIRPSGSIHLWLSGIVGDQVDFANIQDGNRLTLNPGIQYKMGSRFSIKLDHLYEKLNVDGGKLYTAHLTNFQLVYQFSRRAFLRTIFQYVDYKYNTSLYSIPLDPEFKHLFSQVLFSYKINPQTVLFLGYSDDYYGYSMIPIYQNNRTFFLKIGYALVL